MSSKLDKDVLTDLLIKKTIQDKIDQQTREENDRMLRIELPNPYDYNLNDKIDNTPKEPRRVIIIDI